MSTMIGWKQFSKLVQHVIRKVDDIRNTRYQAIMSSDNCWYSFPVSLLMEIPHTMINVVC